MAQAERDAIRLLDEIRRLEVELDEHRAKLAHVEKDDLECDTLEVLEVGCGGEMLLIPVASVCEVVGMPWPETLPAAPPFILGTVHYGEQPVPILDIHQQLGGEGLGVSVNNYLVILNQPSWVGLVVDRIGVVRRLDRNLLAGDGLTTPHAGFVLAEVKIDDASAHLLSPRTLCSQVEDDDVR